MGLGPASGSVAGDALGAVAAGPGNTAGADRCELADLAVRRAARSDGPAFGCLGWATVEPAGGVALLGVRLRTGF